MNYRVNVFFVYFLLLSIWIYLMKDKIVGGFPQILDVRGDLLIVLIFLLTLLVFYTTSKEGFYGWIPISTRITNPTTNMSYDLRGDPLFFDQSPPYMNRNYYGPFIYRLFPYNFTNQIYFRPIWNTTPKYHPIVNKSCSN